MNSPTYPMYQSVLSDNERLRLRLAEAERLLSEATQSACDSICDEINKFLMSDHSAPAVSA
jgi:hypothetical protein